MKELRDETYICPDCLTKQVVWRKPGLLREKFHKKNLFCYVCKEKKRFTKIYG